MYCSNCKNESVIRPTKNLASGERITRHFETRCHIHSPSAVPHQNCCLLFCISSAIVSILTNSALFECQDTYHSTTITGLCLNMFDIFKYSHDSYSTNYFYFFNLIPLTLVVILVFANSCIL